jgi:VWFA-related protein
MPNRKLAIASIVLAASPGMGAGQEKFANPPVPIIEQARSQLVLIEVYARDGSGKTVTDLRADELTLRIDQIQSLDFIPSAEERETGQGAPPAEPTAPLGALEAHRRRPRRFLLFFDDSTSSVPHMTAARKAAFDFLDGQGAPTDQFCVAAYGSRRKLEILVEFTADRAAVRAALKRSLEDPTRHEDYASEREARFEEIARAEKEKGTLSGQGPLPPGGSTKVMSSAPTSDPDRLKRTYALQDQLAMARVLNLLRVLVDALRSWDGYKAILMFGDGIPENPAADYGVNDPRRTLTDELSQLAFAAAGSEVTLHTIQTEGLVAGTAAQNAASARRSNALATLALDTGGIQRRSNDPLSSMTDIEAATHGYYLLAYEPEGPPDGEKHSVHLKCLRSGVTLRYRQFFTRFTPEQGRQRSLEAAYSVPEVHDTLGVQLTAVAGPVARKERVVDLVVYVPAGKLLFLPRPGGAAGVAEVGIVALDADGHETLRRSRRVDLGVDMHRALQGGALGFDFYARVRLPLEVQTLTAVVSDLQSGDIGAARIRLPQAIASPVIHGLSLYSGRDQSLWIDFQDLGEGLTHATAGRFTIGPALKRRFTPGETIRCGFRPAPGGLPPASLRFAVGRDVEVVRDVPLPEAASATGAGGEPVEGTPGRDTLEFDLPIDDMHPGEYWLRAEQIEPSGSREVGRIPFAIVPD